MKTHNKIVNGKPKSGTAVNRQYGGCYDKETAITMHEIYG